MKHYTIEELDRFLHVDMGALARIKCSSHIKTCQDCQKRLEQLKADDSLLSKIRHAVKEMNTGNS